MLTRILTGAVLALGCFAAFGFVHSAFLTLSVLFVFVAVGGAEFLAMCWAQKGDTDVKSPKLGLKHWFFGATYAVPLMLQGVFCVSSCRPQLLVGLNGAWCAILLLVNAAFVWRKYSQLEKAVQVWMAYLAGFVYLALPGLVLLNLVQLQAGKMLWNAPFWFAIAVVYMGDTGAYFTGVSLGKRKLIPAVSPKKTWEGSVGGLVWSAATAVVLNLFFEFQMHWAVAIFAGILMGASGQIGDLVESAVKRVSGYKDSGWIFPGHGGVLDRIDSLLFAAPVCYGIFLACGIA